MTLIITMEEQLVPSAGFSPQSDSYGTDFTFKFSSHGFCATGIDDGSSLTSGTNSSNYCNLADAFDLSLLGDNYDDQDMATVPSPSSWSPMNAMNEPTCWQQSFYASSPSGDSYAYSPDSKAGILANDVSTSPMHSITYDNFDNHHQQHLNVSTGLIQALTSNNNNIGNRNLLLRQCLEDTSFQQKCNFKPLDLPTMSTLGQNDQQMAREMANNTPTSEDVGSCLELNQIEPVFSLAYEQMRSEIQNTCSLLAISPDPMQWSCSDVQVWLNNTLSSLSGMTNMSNNLAATNEMCLRQFWNIEGRRLCSLNEEEFRRLDVLNGDYIFAQLELWKMLQGKMNVGNSSSAAGASATLGSSAQQQQQQQPFDLDQFFLGSALSPASCPSPSLLGANNTPSAEGTSEDKGRKSPTLSMDSSSNSSCSSFDHGHSPSRSSPSSFPSPVGFEHMNTDDEENESEVEVDIKPTIIKTEVTSPTKTTTKTSVAKGSKASKAKGSSSTGGSTTKTGAHIHLWQFLKELLSSPQQHGSCIRWLDQSRGIFKIEDSVRVARLWGLRKNRPAMNYDKLSRSIRQYYRKGIMRKTERSQRLVYQFCHPYGL